MTKKYRCKDINILYKRFKGSKNNSEIRELLTKFNGIHGVYQSDVYIAFISERKTNHIKVVEKFGSLKKGRRFEKKRRQQGRREIAVSRLNSQIELSIADMKKKKVKFTEDEQNKFDSSDLKSKVIILRRKIKSAA